MLWVYWCGCLAKDRKNWVPSTNIGWSRYNYLETIQRLWVMGWGCARDGLCFYFMVPHWIKTICYWVVHHYPSTEVVWKSVGTNTGYFHICTMMAGCGRLRADNIMQCCICRVSGTWGGGLGLSSRHDYWVCSKDDYWVCSILYFPPLT